MSMSPTVELPHYMHDEVRAILALGLTALLVRTWARLDVLSSIHEDCAFDVRDCGAPRGGRRITITPQEVEHV